jgi:RimJ/RimL family protein N-acetyltransferase
MPDGSCAGVGVQVVLETERLVLRRLTRGDVDRLVELDADPAVMRFLTGGKPTPRAVIEEELLPALLAEYERFPGLGRWAAINRATEDFEGWFALAVPNGGDGRVVELGYRLRSQSWGIGLATEGAAALVEHAFARLGVQRVFAETMAVNAASRRVMEKAGLRFVRVFHLQWDDPIEGTEQGEVEYALELDQWQAKAVTAGA